MSAGSVVRVPGRPVAHPCEATRPRSRPKATRRRARGWRTAVIAVGAIALTWAFAPFVLVALDAAAHHRVFLGVAGYYPMDGLQYLAWVRDAHDGLIRNLYGSRGHAVFVHPMYSLTGLLQGATGVGSPAIMAFWKAVGALSPRCRLRARGGELTSRPSAWGDGRSP